MDKQNSMGSMGDVELNVNIETEGTKTSSKLLAHGLQTADVIPKHQSTANIRKSPHTDGS